MRAMGVDCGTRKVSYALIDGDILLEAETLVMDEHEPRGAQLKGLGEWLAYKFDFSGSNWLWIESIIVGNNRKYSVKLAEVYGAVLGAAYTPEKGFGTVDNKQWKKEIVGNGNAKKEQIAQWLDDHHPGWSLLCHDQDQIDAACITLYGQEIVSKADGLKLA